MLLYNLMICGMLCYLDVNIKNNKIFNKLL